MMATCNLTNITEVTEELKILDNILLKYIFQLRLVFFGACLVQCLRGMVLSRFGFAKNQILAVFLFLSNIFATPVIIFIEMVKSKLGLRDPERENGQRSKFTKEVSKHRSRYEFKIIEAFRESLAACRVQVGFYLAFSFIVGQYEEYEKVDCIAKALLGSEESIFTIKVFTWYGIPRLAFSAIMSLISITFAQVSLYKTRHEFDMSILGQRGWLLSHTP